MTPYVHTHLSSAMYLGVVKLHIRTRRKEGERQSHFARCEYVHR